MDTLVGDEQRFVFDLQPVSNQKFKFWKFFFFFAHYVC